jgi:carbamoyltransferase
MIILGLNVFHADTSACLIVDGKLVTAVEEERFTRIKHFTGFPKNSIDYCLKESNINLNDVDYICLNYNKNYNFKEKLFFSLRNFYASNFLRKAFFSLRTKSLNKLFLKSYNVDISKKIKYVPHHLAHICSTFYFNKLENSIGFSFDGSGDFSTTEIFNLGKEIKLLEKINYPDSLGIFYQAFTQFLGFKNYGDEYKVMGLASYGSPIYKERIKKIIKSDNNFFELDLEYFDHHKSVIDYDFESGYPFFEDLFSHKLEKIFGKARGVNEPIEKIHKDIAASLQKGFEEIIIKKLISIKKKYNHDNLCLAGGCAFNSSLNGVIIKETNFKNIYLSPNVGDAGGALGAALYIAKQNNEKLSYNSSPYLGTYYDNKYVEEKVINKIKNMKHIKYKYYENFDELNHQVVKKLSNGCVVGWFQDKMEWGPRALGNRSILGDPRNPDMREIINIKIKKREDFRPFAPSVIKEEANKYFDMNQDSPYMCAVYEAKNEIKHLIPAVVHVDGTARVQTVDRKSNEKFYSLINTFGKITGIPIILNTSLNVNEPICENPGNALEIFSKTSMDMIVIQNWVLEKNA